MRSTSYTDSAATKGEIPSYSGTPLIRSPMGQNVWWFLADGQKSGRNIKEVAVRQGFTVL